MYKSLCNVYSQIVKLSAIMEVSHAIILNGMFLLHYCIKICVCLCMSMFVHMHVFTVLSMLWFGIQCLLNSNVLPLATVNCMELPINIMHTGKTITQH